MQPPNPKILIWLHWDGGMITTSPTFWTATLALYGYDITIDGGNYAQASMTLQQVINSDFDIVVIDYGNYTASGESHAIALAEAGKKVLISGNDTDEDNFSQILESVYHTNSQNKFGVTRHPHHNAVVSSRIHNYLHPVMRDETYTEEDSDGQYITLRMDSSCTRIQGLDLKT